MTFTAVVGDVPLQLGTGGLNFTTDGAVYKGQAVYSSGNKTVRAIDSQHSGALMTGICAYSKADAEQVCVYGPGNLVTARISGTVTAGTLVGPFYDGELAEGTKYPRAVVTKGVAATGEGEVLLY